MIDKIYAEINSHNIDVRNDIGLPKAPVSKNLSEALSNVRRQRLQYAKAANERYLSLLGNDMMMRLMYVPFAVGELVWDYADTVVTMAECLGDKATKPLIRTIKELRNTFKADHSRYLDADHRRTEVDNGLVFEEAVESEFNMYLMHLRTELKSRYPELDPDNLYLVEAVYQCHLTAKALLLYTSKIQAKAAKRLGRDVFSVLPLSMRRLPELILEFAGDKQPSDKFMELHKTYIRTLAAKIEEAEFTDLPK